MLPGATGATRTFESHNAITTLDYIAIPVSLVANISKCCVNDRHCLNTSDHLPV